ncbi:MAG: chorismate-binding protein [Dehalococcoidia bacterium]|jgi:anthranilate synthase component 1|nr:chorismate-binding protein [Dehalococcoidia bacterium]MDP7613065.1 chorismate-binding protein [Dehalococcoidia bacterium]
MPKIRSVDNKFNITYFKNPGIKAYDAYTVLHKTNSVGFIFEQNSHSENSSTEGRFGYVCISADKVLRTGLNEPSGQTNPFELIKTELESYDKSISSPIIPALEHAFYSGAFGYISYECCNYFEPSVGKLKPSPLGVPESTFIFPSELLIFDNKKQLIYLISNKNIKSTDGSKQSRQEFVKNKLSSFCEIRAKFKSNISRSYSSYPSRKSFERMVTNAITEIRGGELIQVVLSRRIELNISCSSERIYRSLRKINFSPYTYLMDLGDFQIVGASPELMSRTINRKSEIHPIAGTFPRNSIIEIDKNNELQMLLSEKEKSEHIMLVDLARNDLGRVCKPGSIEVGKLMSVEKYSHVMHLVSKVSGLLLDHVSGIDALKSGFPMGTLTGAPKIRAIKLASELESEGRGPYCGTIGWFGSNGNVDTGTLIRSVIVKQGKGHIQVGAGIVFDSSPPSEYNETQYKANACLRAVAAAHFEEEK